MSTPGISPEAVQAELARIVASQAFAGANRSAQLLQYLVNETLAGRGAYLKEYSLGAEALGRGAEFDPRADPIARVEASRLRNRLELYYATEGRGDGVSIALPKGGYVPRFEPRALDAAAGAGAGRSGAAAARVAVALGLAAVAIAAFALGRAWPTRSPAAVEGQPLRMSIALGANGTLGSEVGSDLALSPDGATLVFVALVADGSTRLFTRRLDALDAYELPGTVGARGPFFSPDSRWVGFWSQGKLRKTLAAGGGSPVVLADATDLLGASWGENGEIVATLSLEPTLWRLPESGGTPRPLVALERPAHPRWPQLIARGRAVLYTATSGDTDRSIEVVTLADGARKTLVRGGTYGRVLANGDLVYVDRGALFAVPFDADKLEVRGAPVRVLDSVDYSAGFGYAEVAAADNGTLVYRRSAGSGLTTLAWLDGNALPEPALAEPAHYLWPRLSPDGKRIAFDLLESSDYDIWVYDLAARAKTRITMDQGDETSPLWTPDGGALLYATPRGELVWQRSDGSGKAVGLLPGVSIPWSFAPGGARVAYHKMSAETGFDLWTAPVVLGANGAVAGREERFYGTAVFDTYPTFSPDGRFIAYGSNESGVWEVYVRAFPDDGRAVRVSANGGRIPAWSKTTAELLYETNDHRLMALAYRVTGGAFVAEAPRPWSSIELADTGVLANYDVAPDGRVLAVLPAEGPRADRDTVTVLTNAFAEFRRLEK